MTGLLAWLGTGATVVAMVFTLFVNMDDAFPSLSRKVATAIAETTFDSWADTVKMTFQEFFGSNPFSLRCFIRTTIATYSCVFAILFGWGIMENEIFSKLLGPHLPKIILAVLIVTALISLIPNYTAFLTTRFFLAIAEATGRLTVPLIGNMIITGAIGFLVLVPIAMELGPQIFSSWGGVLSFGGSHLQFLVIPEQGLDLGLGVAAGQGSRLVGTIPFAVWYYAVFSWNLWLWVFIGTLGTTQLLERVARFTNKTDLPILSRPFEYCGWAFSALFSLVWLVFGTVSAVL